MAAAGSLAVAAMLGRPRGRRPAGSAGRRRPVTDCSAASARFFPRRALSSWSSRSGGPDLVRWIESGAAFYLNSDSSAARDAMCPLRGKRGSRVLGLPAHSRLLDGDHPAMWKAARSQGHSTAVPLAAWTWRKPSALPSGVMRQAIAAQRHCGSARRKNSSLVPYP